MEKSKELKFLLKVFIFCIPFVIVLGLPILALYVSGEALSSDAMVARMASPSPVLVGLTYTNPICYLDLHLVLAKNPEVLVLGSSRVQEIRSTFFKSGTNVVTASGCAQKISHLRALLEKIPANQNPKLLLLGLDQRFFDPYYDSLAPDNIDDLLTKPTDVSEVLMDWSNVYRDYLEGKIRTADFAGLLHPQSSLIGFFAIVRGEGFRNDGSRALGNQLHLADNALAVIDGNLGGGWEYSNAVSAPALGELDKLLQECRQRNITVVGFLAPISPAVYRKVMSMPDHYGYLIPLASDVSAVFKKFQFDFFDFSDPTNSGITDNEMQDSSHTTERGTLLYFINMAEADRSLRQYADPGFLKTQLASTQDEQDIVKIGNK